MAYLLGAHVSTKGGVQNAPLNAAKIGASAFALFLKNQRRWFEKPYPPERVRQFKENLRKVGIKPEAVLPHASYLVNLCSPSAEVARKSLRALKDEALRAQTLGLKYLNFHPGARGDRYSEDRALRLVAAALNRLIEETEKVVFVVENTAGQGTTIGYRLEHLARILELVRYKDRVGVCLDTAHLFAAGYDLSTEEGFFKTFELFEELIGFEFLKGVHLNDSLVPLGSR
ncbi:MAG: deoxyribonuclease IV, partial [Aquificae bacterium]|nr:deoxyribonuclease IV [Aquificota bacterium]